MKLNDLIPNQAPRKTASALDAVFLPVRERRLAAVPKAKVSRTGSGGRLYRQGGNLPFFRRLPFVRGKGFTPPYEVEFNEVNLDQLASFKADAEITPETLQKARLLRDPRNPVAILGRGELKTAIKVRVHRVTKSAKAKIEAAGGSVELIG